MRHFFVEPGLWDSEYQRCVVESSSHVVVDDSQGLSKVLAGIGDASEYEALSSAVSDHLATDKRNASVKHRRAWKPGQR
jgi:hypothetical protein